MFAPLPWPPSGNDARIGLRDGGNGERRLKHVSPVHNHPHVEVAELQDIGLKEIELERNQVNGISRILRPSHKLGPGPVAHSAVCPDEEISKELTCRMIFGKIDPRVKGRGNFSGGEGRLNEVYRHYMILRASKDYLPPYQPEENP